MRLVVMQPSYLPWLGYFDLLHRADLFLVYDNVQYDKDGWRNRNKIKTPQGAQWLTVPVLTKGQNKPTNREVKINAADQWARKHLKSVELNYAKAPFFTEVRDLLKPVWEKNWDYLLDLNLEFLKVLSGYLGIEANLKLASDLKMEWPEGKNEKLIALCKEVGADSFYEPKGGEGYIDAGLFEKEGIELTLQNFDHPEYPQLFGNFISHLSVIDLLFNCGPQSASYLKKTLAKD